MSRILMQRVNRVIVLMGLAVLVAACGERVKPDMLQGANIPSSFDVTVLSEKDNQFDFDGAPLTEEDLKSALRYRKDESLPVGTVLLKRGEKQKITNQHIISLARVAYQLGIKAFVKDKNGEISEIRAEAKQPES